QVVDHPVHMRLSHGKFHRTIVVEHLVPDFQVLVFHYAHHLIHLQIIEFNMVDVLLKTVDNVSVHECLLGGGLVGVDQSRNAQQSAAEIPHHHHQHICHLIRKQHVQDRSARRSGRLAIVVHPKYRPVEAQPIGITMVPGLRMKCPYFVEYSF